MDFTSVDAYLNKMSNTGGYMELDATDKEKKVFEASELLKDHFDASKLTDRAVALQTIYMLEGDEEGFGRLKRQGVKSYSVKGVSVSFEGSGISDDVLLILTARRGGVARMI